MLNENCYANKKHLFSVSRQNLIDFINDLLQDELGLIPRICKTLFTKMAASAASTEDSTSFRTEASYLEIYNERVKDLLGPSNAEHHLKVREHPKDGIEVFLTASKDSRSLKFENC